MVEVELYVKTGEIKSWRYARRYDFTISLISYSDGVDNAGQFIRELSQKVCTTNVNARLKYNGTCYKMSEKR